MSTPCVSKMSFSCFSAFAFALAFCTSACCAASRRFCASFSRNSAFCPFWMPFSSRLTSAARSSVPAAALATCILCCMMPSKMASASVISGTFITSPSIRPASSTRASSYSATSANRLIIFGLMASCRFISTSSHSVLSMLSAPSTPACSAALFHSARAPSRTKPAALTSFTMLSYCSAGLPSRTPSACRRVTPCRRASATASPQLPYRRTSSAFAAPVLFTVYSSLCSSGYSSHSSLLR